MDKLNNYIPVPIITPQPTIIKTPCLTPACAEKRRVYEASMKQPQSLPTLHNNLQQNQLK